MSVLRLAIPTPLRRLFDYLPPAGISESDALRLQPGLRLRVPFGRRQVTAYLVAVSPDSELPVNSLKNALEILDLAPLLPSPLVQLCNWASRYYQHPPGEVYAAAFPSRLRGSGPARPPADAGWRLTTRGMGLPAGAPARAPRQAQTLAMLQQQPAISSARFKAEGISPAILKSLLDKDLVERCAVPCSLEQAESGPGLACPGLACPGLTLNPEQQEVLTTILKLRRAFSCHLLDGVTGSGKTEIYLQLIADCLSRGEQALVLIPEIGLTPQTLARFQQRFTATIAVIHSGLGDTERYRSWEAARSGNAHIVMGTRSAVFTPMKNPGLIIVDEEHDGSFKQQDGFRYSARDVAVKRAQLEDCPVLLGSATPSLESYYNALAGRYLYHRLTSRAGTASMPAITALDLRRQDLQAGLSKELLTAIDDTLGAGQQALLFLNRRGYAATLRCHDCGWIAGCDACDARLTVHRRQHRLRCHHCGASRAMPVRCPACLSSALLAEGLGTQQTEDFLRTRFRQWPVFRVDSDSMQGRNAMQELVTQISRDEPCILLGTQMLTKGHHFPAVTLVAVIDADAMLFSADFRGEERMAQLLTQVAGRAGRADVPGRMIIQTHYPDHPTLQNVLSVSYADQARDMLAARQATSMPPAGQLIMVRTDCDDIGFGEQFLQTLRRDIESALPTGVRLIGPLPSPMQRRAGKFRCQLALLAPDRKSAQIAASQLVAQAETQPLRRGLKWSIDVDPQDMF